MLGPTVAPAAVAPDVTDMRTGAQPLERLGREVEAIDRPGDHDWYSLSGSEIGDEGSRYERISTYVDISVLAAGLGCTASQPLFVVLRNPEGRWIRTYSVSTKATSFPAPALPGRYYLEIRAADPGCFALLYQLSLSFAASIEAHVFANVRGALCRIAHNDRLRRTMRVRSLTRRRRALRSRAARRRYARYIKTRRHQLARARAEERQQCGKVA